MEQNSEEGMVLAKKWYYLHDGRTEGPVGSDVLQRLALAGELTPQDPIWPEGADRGAAVEAQSALLFPIAAGLPDWLEDVRTAEDRGQARPVLGGSPLMPGSVGVPDWIQDSLGVPPPKPAEPPPDETGVDPLTGRVLDATKFGRYLEEQNVVRRTRLAMELIPSLHERLQKAKFEIEEWADRKANRALVLAGDLEAIRADPALREALAAYAEWGPEMMDKLWRHVAFVVENRRKFYASRPGGVDATT